MANIPFQFCGPSSVNQSPYFDNEDALGCYCEKAEVEGTRSQIAMWPVPGKKRLAALSESSVPSCYTVNGRTFFASSNLWELTENLTVTNWGSLGTPPVAPTQITANAYQLVVMNNGNLFVFTLATNTFEAVDMAQFNGPIKQIDFADGYVLAIIQNSTTFQQSNLEDATTWSGLNIASVSYFPDNLVAMKCDHREAWFWSAKKAVIYYNSGAGFPVFIPIQGAFLEVGCCATFSPVQMDNSIFWLSQDEHGSLVGFRANGYAGERKSTHAQELAWQNYGTPYGQDAVGFSYQEQGHTFWQLYFPSANATWDYDVASGYWHKRGDWQQTTGTYRADNAMCHTFNFGMHLVGDPFSGNVYEMSSSILTNDGRPIRGFRRSPTVGENNDWLYFDSIEFKMQVGQAPLIPLYDGDGQPRPPQIMLRWSDDAGQTWSNTYFLSIGYQGEFEKRVIKRMLGRSRDRVWEVAWIDPVAIRFTAAYLRGTGAIAA
jgi:hypothetical protein